jgi:prepilin-type N-terminal cleavage/methylation domain-containing protein
MRERGFSLVEILVVIGLVAILLAIALPWFAAYLKHGSADSQTRLIYAELLQARANALYLRRETRVKFYPGSFAVYSTATDGPSVAPVASQPLRFPIEWNNSGANVDFDPRGIALNGRSICIAGREETGAVDSVVVSDTRVNIGKKNIDRKDDQWDCAAGNITIR